MVYSNIIVHSPKSVEEALRLLSEMGPQVRLTAGCTDVLVQLRSGLIREREFVDLSGIDELRYIFEDEKGLIHIGALTTIAQCVRSDVLKEKAPILWESLRIMGSPQIRNMGTIGGNLGNASPAADSLPPLYVLDAKVKVKSLSRTRTVGVEDFFVGPRKTILASDEIIEEIVVKPMLPSEKGFFRRATLREAHTITVASVASCFEIAHDGCFKNVRVALGAVAPTVMRARQTEQFLQGSYISKEVLRRAAEIAASECRPITDVRGSEEYRRALVKALLYQGFLLTTKL